MLGLEKVCLSLYNVYLCEITLSFAYICMIFVDMYACVMYILHIRLGFGFVLRLRNGEGGAAWS